MKEQTQPLPNDSSVTNEISKTCSSSSSSNQLSTAQVSQFSLNHTHKPTEESLPHKPTEESLPQKAVLVDTSEVDALLEKFKSEIEVCQRHVYATYNCLNRNQHSQHYEELNQVYNYSSNT